MDKKIVKIDTNVLKKNIIPHLKQEYPADEYIMAADDTVYDELMGNDFLADKTDYCKRNLDLINDLNIKVLPGFERLINWEHMNGPEEAKKSLKEDLELSKISEEIKLLFNGQHPDQQAIKLRYEEPHKVRKEAQKSTYDNIPYTDESSCKIDVSQLRMSLNQKIVEGKVEPIIFPPKDEFIMDINKRFVWVAYKTSRSTRYNGKTIKYFDNVDDFIKRFPSIYDILLWDEFMKNVKRPTHSKNKDSFQLVLVAGGKNQAINCKKNDLSDHRIALACMHYLDFFVTTDKNLKTFTGWLYPEYTEKIRNFTPKI